MAQVIAGDWHGIAGAGIVKLTAIEQLVLVIKQEQIRGASRLVGFCHRL